MMATVVLNLTGLMTGLVHLFLRSNSTSTSFRPRGMKDLHPGSDKPLRLWGPNELAFGGAMTQPVSGPRSPNTIGSRSSLIGPEKAEELHPNSPYNYELKASPAMSFPARPETAVASPSNGRARKQSYSIFPVETISPTLTTLTAQPTTNPASNFSTQRTQNDTAPTSGSRVKDAMSAILFSRRDLASDSIYSTNDQSLLAPPRPIFQGRGHNRDSSMASSATVQIGLRLSNMLGPQIGHSAQSSSASNTFLAPTTFGTQLKRPNSPDLRLQTNLAASPLAQTIYKSSLASSSNYSPGGVRSPLTKAERDARMKTLPPVPRITSEARVRQVVQEEREQGLVLSPTVYSPVESRKFAPKIQSPMKRPSAGSPKISSPTIPLAQNPLSPGKASPRASKLDWI
jgi:hypothetical protein